MSVYGAVFFVLIFISTVKLVVCFNPDNKKSNCISVHISMDYGVILKDKNYCSSPALKIWILIFFSILIIASHCSSFVTNHIYINNTITFWSPKTIILIQKQFYNSLLPLHKCTILRSNNTRWGSESITDTTKHTVMCNEFESTNLFSLSSFVSLASGFFSLALGLSGCQDFGGSYIWILGACANCLRFSTTVCLIASIYCNQIEHSWKNETYVMWHCMCQYAQHSQSCKMRSQRQNSKTEI